MAARDVKASSRRHFDRWAASYERDQVSRWLADRQRDALEQIALVPSDALLDIGCGTGAAVRAAAPRVSRAVGVDLSAEMIAQGRERAAGIGNLELLEADAEALPFEDETFTAVMCTTSFHHYPSPGRAIGEMGRVLTPGGRVLIADMTTDRVLVRLADRAMRRFQASHVGMQRSENVAQLFLAAGLIDPRTRPIYGGLYAYMSARKAARSGVR
jgi:ubiquinone/menaquinone biosynthesis C-methylase UbiE